MQNDEPSLQCLVSSHSPEQQSPFAAHSLPPVLQLGFRAVHVWSAPQMPLQQASLLVHALPSETHCSVEHLPSMQLNEQQSVLAAHESPELAQVVTVATQPDLASQAPEQQSPPPLHGSPTARHELPPPMLVPLALPPECEPAVLLLRPPFPLCPVPVAPPPDPSMVELEPPHAVQSPVALMMMAAKLRARRILNLHERWASTSKASR